MSLVPVRGLTIRAGATVIDDCRTLTVPPGTLAPDGPAGAVLAVGGGGGAGAVFTHVQSTPAITWTVNHNLGSRPDVSVFSPGGVVVLAHVVHTSLDQTVIQFVQPSAGTARLSL